MSNASNKNNDDDHIKLLLQHFENVMHDIKTPLSIIYLVVQNIEKTPNQPEEFIENIQIIKKYCLRIIELTHELNDSNKFLSGRFNPNFKNYNLVELAEAVAQSIAPVAARRNIDIIFDTDTTEKMIAVDKILFERAMLNILSNAIKFSNENENIDVIFRDGINRIVIEIIDRGIGFKNNDVTSIFERYVSDDSLFNQHGSGIGLSLVHEMIEVLGGTVAARSGKGGIGAVVSLELPCSLLPEDSNSAEEDYPNAIQTDLFDI